MDQLTGVTACQRDDVYRKEWQGKFSITSCLVRGTMCTERNGRVSFHLLFCQRDDVYRKEWQDKFSLPVLSEG